ncbi:MAG: hypothetical protein JWP87_129 [Labilithrix sp.]|jgi:hypothetical protein|nr:hypothetical protein [Labilithrix sp.]
MVRGSKFRGYPDAAHGLLVTHAERVSQDILEFVGP